MDLDLNLAAGEAFAVEPTGTKDTPVAAGIDGVESVRLRPHVDHRGTLTEVMNASSAFWREPVVHVYDITIRPARIKGWGMHRVQADRYYLAAGSVRVVLHDGRTASPTFGRFQELWFTDQSPALLRIPPGVWHADQNWGDDDARIVNFPTHPYNPADPDKHRIDPHGGEIPYDWSLPDG